MAEDVRARLERWTRAGGTWRADPAPGGRVTVVLQRCDGGEEVDRFVCEASELPAEPS
ncbi:hypothetical protein [Aeromicrobium massiliense]|uniref:hypothetical protein n=1 Tax=Aeromicrobium massiliense TaxID=1464554 RepID=UPI00030D9693|nr:hypothetical protein [Aeromicrobium massiliense]